jgi:hypothetical protein
MACFSLPQPALEPSAAPSFLSITAAPWSTATTRKPCHRFPLDVIEPDSAETKSRRPAPDFSRDSECPTPNVYDPIYGSPGDALPLFPNPNVDVSSELTASPKP